MKAADLKVGGVYVARVSGQLVRVRIDDIYEAQTVRINHYSGIMEYVDQVRYTVTNLATRRRTTFHSPQRFRREVTAAERVREETKDLYR